MSNPPRSDVHGDFGVVSATNRFAARAGMAMLDAGGNAFDAAVAAAFVLQVVEPHLSGPAGEVSMVFFAQDDGRPRVLCGQGPAPAGATPDHFADQGLGLVPSTGVLSAPVPGAFDAWMVLLRDYGTKSLREVLDQALGHAEGGYPLLFVTALRIAGLERVLRQHWPTSAAVYLPDGRLPEAGELFRNPRLAETYRRILAEAEAAGGGRERQIEAARRAWYRGFVAEEIERFAAATHPDPTFGPLAGVITAADLAGFEATYESPVTMDWQDWTICKPGAWSQGPVFLQQLGLLDGFDELFRGARSAEYVHVVVEAAKLAFADREAYYGDVPDVPLGALLSYGYADSRRALISTDASWEIRPGSVNGRQPRLSALVPESIKDVPQVEQAMARATAGRLPAPSGDTCHVAVADRFGNLIGATPSGGFLMNSPVVGTLGFPLGSRLEMTHLEDGLPNTLAPGKRPRTTISSTLALRDGQPVLAFGTPGADHQEQWSLLFFLGVQAGLDLRSAMDRPVFHTNHLAGSMYPHRTHLGQIEIEGSIPEAVVTGLRQRGHEVIVRKPASLGRLCAVRRDPTTGLLSAGADARHGQAHAYGH